MKLPTFYNATFSPKMECNNFVETFAQLPHGSSRDEDKEIEGK